MKFCAQSELTRATVLLCLNADLSKPQIKDFVRASRLRVEAFVQDSQHAYRRASGHVYVRKCRHVRECPLTPTQ